MRGGRTFVQPTIHSYFRPSSTDALRLVCTTYQLRKTLQRQPSPIQDLPVEIIELICEKTSSTAELKALRQTCRALNDKTLRVFASRHVGELTICLDKPSLERLIKISKHSIFSKAVCRLRIYETSHSLSEFDEWIVDDELLLSIEEKDDLVRDAKASHVDVCVNEELTVKMQIDAMMLAEALRNLRHLDLIKLCLATGGCEGDGSYGAFWDPVVGQYQNHGNQHRSGLMCHPEHTQLPFGTLVSALNASGARIPKLKAGGPRCRCGMRGFVRGPDLSLPGTFNLGYRQMLRSLQSLELNLELRGGSYAPPRQDYRPTQVLIDFLRCTPMLRSLTLGSLDTPSVQMIKNDENVFRQVHLQHLREFKLGDSWRLDCAIVDFLSRHWVSLRSIGLEHIYLTAGTLLSLLTLLASPSFEKLDNLFLRELYDGNRPVLFLEDGENVAETCKACASRLAGHGWWDPDDGNDCKHMMAAVRGEHAVSSYVKRVLQYHRLCPAPHYDDGY